MTDLSCLNGKTIESIEGLEKYSQEVVIRTVCGDVYKFEHEQDCCEDVLLEDFDLDCDLKGSLITSALEVSSEHASEPKDNDRICVDDSFTWTFYKIETNKGGLFLRWFGTSNGYYSEDISVFKNNKRIKRV